MKIPNGNKIVERSKRQTTDIIDNESSCIKTQRSTKCFGQFCLPKNYDKLAPPTNFYGNNETIKAVDVNLDFDIRVFEVNDVKFTISFTMYFGIRWEEPRLSKTNDSKTFGTSFERVDLDMMQHLWLPSIYVLNLKSYKTLNILSDFAGLWIMNDTHIWYSTDSQVTFWCPMRFSNYPLDSQICPFIVGSYGYDNQKVRLFTDNLSQGSFTSLDQNAILDYGIKLRKLIKEVTWDSFEFTSHLNFTNGGFELIMKRHKLKYIINHYLPSGLFVIVSWVSFLVPPEVIPGRMSLLVTLFLVLINIFNSITESSPNAQGLTAISSWVISCIFFVFAALVEYAGILLHMTVFSKSSEEQDHLRQEGSVSKTTKTVESKSFCKRSTRSVDILMGFIFPITFIIFNFIYWIYFLNKET